MRSTLSGAGEEYAMLAARSSYSAAGHVVGGLLQIVSIGGIEAPNVIELSTHRLARRTHKAPEHDDHPC